ncbi:MAG: hypothetical protein GX961_09435, partial [Firmicutes bacterium]|nr:hypothetical protein [Bacillota bacterium]
LFAGLIYGAGVMIDQFQRGRLKEREGRELFFFLGACHSVLEDPFLFVPVGVGPALLLPVRIVAGGLVLLYLAARQRWSTRTAQPAPLPETRAAESGSP